MLLSSKWCWAFYARRALLVTLILGTPAEAAVPASEDAAQLLRHADSIKTSNHAEFTALIERLDDGAKKLPPEQQFYLRYLNAWDVAYHGDYATAIPQLNSIIAESADANLRFRAGITTVNLLGIATHYQEAFSRLSQLVDQLPHVSDKHARIQTFGIASQLYAEAGQYDLASVYADQLLKENPTAEGACKGDYLKLDALYRGTTLQTLGKKFQDGIDICVKAGEPIFANLIRSHVASFDIQQGRYAEAIALLQRNYEDVQRTRYRRLISEFDASLAQAYWKDGETALAQRIALKAVETSVENEYTEPLTIAYQLLYLIAKTQGDTGEALAYHEKFMAADKGYLNDVSERALAYQTVKQQVMAKKLQIDTLNKQNQILQLQQKLASKAAVTSRLYIILLLTVLASIALWTYKVKRSQLRFMKLARRDGLTGIFNRQHFVEEVEQLLVYCKKSAWHACIVLIDLDYFKVVNDTHGHAVGDRVLRRAVEACQAHLRSTDIFGRLGGEEFGILLPDCTLDRAEARAEQIRVAIATASSGDNSPGIPISASFGVAVTARSGYELRELLIHADEALYKAKREGRNRVVVSEEVEECLKTG
jgi:diguanylate cyclase (GGDEF)-like protein